MPKKILIVSTSFTPIISARSFRTTELVKKLAEEGHQVDLLTYKDNPSHQFIERDWGIKIINLGKRPKQIDLNRTGIDLLYARIKRRALLYFLQYPEIKIAFDVKRKLKNLSGYDTLISVATPHPTHWGVGLAFKKDNNIADIWIADSGDPFMMAKYDNLGKPFYLRYIEKLWCRRCTYMSIPRIEMRENFYSKFHDKIYEITQGFKFPASIVKSDQPLNDIPQFAFAGTFMRVGRNPGPLLEFLSKLEMDFRFHIYTKRSVLVDPFKNKLGDKLVIHEVIARDELLKKLAKMDFLVNLGFDPNHQSPSKLVDYYITGRPVVSFETSEIDESKMLEFLQGNYKQQFVLDNMNRFRIENVVDRFLNPTKYLNE